MAEFVARAAFDDLSREALDALRVRVVDSLGCALGALGAPPVVRIGELIDEFGGRPLCTLIGGGQTAPDRAALYNGALVRYLDFNDSYLAKGETCHPSDNLAPILAAAEYADASGRDLLTALAVAYQVQCRLSDAAPVRDRGFDHVTQGAFSVASGVARALALDAERIKNALALAGTALNALRVTRTGTLSHWKGLAFPHTAFAATHLTFLAAHGIQGPPEVFEGNKGWMHSVSGPFSIDWPSEDLERVRLTILKRYNAEIHAQSAIEALLELRSEHPDLVPRIARIEVDIFDVAYKIIGGGEEGDKMAVATKEQADHSLPYLLAVAALDGQVMPEQFARARIGRDDVQRLMRRVVVRPDEELSRRFPAEHACRLRVHLTDGAQLQREKQGYRGFLSDPMTWDDVAAKFERLAAPVVDAVARFRLLDVVKDLEHRRARDLCAALARAKRSTPASRHKPPPEEGPHA